MEKQYKDCLDQFKTGLDKIKEVDKKLSISTEVAVEITKKQLEAYNCILKQRKKFQENQQIYNMKFELNYLQKALKLVRKVERAFIETPQQIISDEQRLPRFRAKDRNRTLISHLLEDISDVGYKLGEKTRNRDRFLFLLIGITATIAVELLILLLI